MSAPNTVAFLINAFVVLAEFWFIGQLGIIPLAAITLAFPAIMLTQQMAFGALGWGCIFFYIKKFRSQHINRAEKLIMALLIYFIFRSLIFFLVFLFFGEWLLVTL